MSRVIAVPDDDTFLERQFMTENPSAVGQPIENHYHRHRQRHRRRLADFSRPPRIQSLSKTCKSLFFLTMIALVELAPRSQGWSPRPFRLITTRTKRIRYSQRPTTVTGQRRKVPSICVLQQLQNSNDDSIESSQTSSSNSNSNNNKNETLVQEPDTLSSRGTHKSSRRPSKPKPPQQNHRKMDLMWCAKDYCKDAVRERVVGQHNQILLTGPATGQVAYQWTQDHNSKPTTPNTRKANDNDNNLSSSKSQTLHQNSPTAPHIIGTEPTVYMLIKQTPQSKIDDHVLKLAANAVKELLQHEIHILLDPNTAARLKHYHGVDDPTKIHLFEVPPTPGFGTNIQIPSDPKVSIENTTTGSPDLICTLGGDGLLMYAAMMFQGPVPPILCVSGGSMGFLTPFKPDEMVDAIKIALGMVRGEQDQDEDASITVDANADGVNGDLDVYPPNMPSYPYEPLSKLPLENSQLEPAQQQAESGSKLASFGLGNRICLSIRMRLDCRILNREGAIKARYNVLNEVVIDRGSSPYLAALECFCDDVHLTTVQADGIIFATPTGSTAYSLAAGSSVVHPAVPCVLVTPICPHVLSFRSMVFPDHVVLRCYVPDDARAEASVAFDGKHRQALHRGDSVQVQMSLYPVPTINRNDHTSDWLGSLKRNFHFNTRARQQPL